MCFGLIVFIAISTIDENNVLGYNYITKFYMMGDKIED